MGYKILENINNDPDFLNIYSYLNRKKANVNLFFILSINKYKCKNNILRFSIMSRVIIECTKNNEFV